MGYKLRRAVRDALPSGLLTSAERLLVLEIADFAGDDSREGWPGVEALAAASGLSLTSIPPMLGRIAAKWIELRVQVAIDGKGRPVYARKGHRTIFRFPRTFAGGQTSMLAEEQTLTAEGLPEPAIPIDGEQTLEAERFAAQQDKVCSSSTPSPQYPSKNSPQSLSQPTTPAAMLAALGVEERERDGLIQKIEEQNNVKSLGFWITAWTNGTLAGCLRRARADPPAAAKPAWCGTCDEYTRQLEITNPDTGRQAARTCPDCYPYLAEQNRQSRRLAGSFANATDTGRSGRPLNTKPFQRLNDYQPYREDPAPNYHGPL